MSMASPPPPPRPAAPRPGPPPIPVQSPLPVVTIGRPWLVTALGVCSIIIGSLGILSNLSAMMMSMGFLLSINHQAAFGVTANSAGPLNPIPASPPTLTAPQPIVPAAEYVPAKGLGAADRAVILEGLAQKHAISDARRARVDDLLADNGDDAFPSGGEPWTLQKVLANVSGVKEVITGEGESDVWYSTGKGTLQVGDRSALFSFRRDEGREPIRAPDLTRDGQGRPVLSDPQVDEVMSRVAKLARSGLNQNQEVALSNALHQPLQRLVTPTASAAAAAAQVKSAVVQSDGSVVVWTNSAATTLTADGQALSGAVPPAAITAAPNAAGNAITKGMPASLSRPLSVVLLDALLGVGLSILLIVAGGMAIGRRPRGRGLFLLWAWIKLPLALAATWGWCRVWSELAAQGRSSDPSAAGAVGLTIAGGAIVLGYPVFVLILLRTKGVRDYFEVPTTARWY